MVATGIQVKSPQARSGSRRRHLEDYPMGCHTEVGFLKMARASLLVFPLLLCLALEGCRGRLDSAWTALVPPDAMALAGVRLEQPRATTVSRKLAEQHPLPRFDEFRHETST